MHVGAGWRSECECKILRIELDATDHLASSLGVEHMTHISVLHHCISQHSLALRNVSQSLRYTPCDATEQIYWQHSPPTEGRLVVIWAMQVAILRQAVYEVPWACHVYIRWPRAATLRKAMEVCHGLMCKRCNVLPLSALMIPHRSAHPKVVGMFCQMVMLRI
jgi:hypothetical protein